MTNKDLIQDLLSRGVVDLEVKENLRKRLENGDKLNVKLGIDPTGSELHLGHSVILRKLRDFQKAGHNVILLIGTFTGKIGDPTGKDQTRPPLTDKEINENMKDFLTQASVIIDTDNIEIVKNGDWLAKMTFEDVVSLASSFTVQQMIKRDSFAKRIEKGQEIALHEFLYPLMQGYDSVPLKADLELGGTDQLFNLLAGRQIQKKYGQKPQDIMTMPILVGIDGKEKMSKSLGNYIGLKEDPREIFGKTMSIPDDIMRNWFELVTSLPISEIEEIMLGHPRDAKLRLAEEIVAELHDGEKAKIAKEEFLRMFQDKGLPDDIQTIIISAGDYDAFDLVIKSNLCSSNSEAKRMFQQGAVKINEKKIDQMDSKITLKSEALILQVGKRKFIKILPE